VAELWFGCQYTLGVLIFYVVSSACYHKEHFFCNILSLHLRMGNYPVLSFFNTSTPVVFAT
jgi:hypothetical protein